MTKRTLAILLVLSLLLTSLGIAPVSAAPSVSTTQSERSDPIREVIPEAIRGEYNETQTDFSAETSRYSVNDVVSVIVELEGKTLLDVAGENINTFVTSKEGLKLAADMTAQQDAIEAQIQSIHTTDYSTMATVNGVEGLNAQFHYNTVFNGFSMNVRYGDLDTIRNMEGVKGVYVAEQYTLPETEGDLDNITFTPSMTSSNGMVGAPEANEAGYDGTGMVVAILDTGFMKAHEAFSVMPTDVKYTKEEMAQRLSQVTLAAGDVTIDQVWVNDKAPFGYNYGNGNTNSEAVGQAHGVHVAGTVAGNNGDDFFGVAPNAQLLIMKIFGDNSGSTGDPTILAGIDDAVKLGADSINMSLGSPCGFSEYGDEDEEETDGVLTYAGVYQRARNAGVSILVAAGNETSTSLYEPNGTGLALVEYPNNGIVSSPSTLPASISVASVDNIGYYKNHVQLADGTKVAYSEAVDYDSQVAYDILGSLGGQTLEYVMIPGLGEESDFAGLDLTGKVAVISRGTINFDAKAQNAANAGAVACIIYNNTNEGPITPAMQVRTIPTLGISLEDGQLMAAAETKTVTFSADYYGPATNPNGYQVSSFSSRGPSSTLAIKPEIAAPGGGIVSSVLGGGYESYNGTSMATPHMAAEAALVQQYLKETYPQMSAYDRAELTNSLLMSTAVPSMNNSTNTYWGVRAQGSGVANAYYAIISEAYLSVQGCDRPKAEVGYNLDGKYSYTVTVHNMADSAKTYTVDTNAMVETVVEAADGQMRIADSLIDLTDSRVKISYTGLTGGKITAPADGTATFTVSIQLTDSGKKYYNDNFPNGAFIEGFTFLTAENEADVDLSLPYLGYFGDFYANLFDGAPNEKLALVGTAIADVDTSGSGNFLGIIDGQFYPERMAYAPQRANRQLMARVTLLNNVTSFRQYVTAPDGTIVWDTGDLGWARKTYGAATMTGVQYTAITYSPGWNGKVGDEWAQDRQWYTFHVEGVAEGDGETVSKEFDFYLDNSKATVSDVELYEQDGESYLSFVVNEDFYLKRLLIIESGVQEYFRSVEKELAEMKQGEPLKITINVTDLGQELAEAGKNPGRIGIFIEDQGLNTSIEWVDLGPQGMYIDPINIEVGETAQTNITFYPAESETDMIYSVEDETIATVDENGLVKGLKDGVTMLTAKTVISGMEARAIVTVGGGEEVVRTFGEDPDIGKTFITDDGFHWKVIGSGEVQLMPYKPSWNSYPDLKGDVVIPATVEFNDRTFNVTSIGPNAFYFNMNITSMVVPEGVREIGYAAFYFNNKITTIQLPDSLERVDTYGLSLGNYSSPAISNMPKNLKYIGDSAFSGISFGESVDLPEGLTYIGTKAFMNDYTIKTVSIPEGVQGYGETIFYNCTNLSYVDLPKDMTEIPSGMFWSCTNLRRISIPEGVTTIGESAFYGSGLEKLELPSTVTVIDDYAYAWLTNMKVIDIPDTVKEIGSNGFIYSKGVEEVNIGTGVETMGKDAFYLWNVNYGSVPRMNVKTEKAASCLRRSGYGQEILLNGVPYTGYTGIQFYVGDITYMPISDTEVQVIGYNAAHNGTTFEIPATVTNEGDDRTYTVTSVNSRVFFQNQSIQTLILPDTLTDVGERAFDQMFNVTSWNVPANLETVGHQGMGFLGWDGKSIGLTFEEGQTLTVPGTVTFLDESAFAGNLQEYVVVEEGVTELPDYCFASMTRAKTVTLPSTLKVIGLAAFRGMTALEELNLPEGLEKIGGEMYDLPLDSIVLPDTLTEIGRMTFGAYVYNSNYTAQYWAGPTEVTLGSSLYLIGADAFRPDAKVIAVTNSQRNAVVASSTLDNLPLVAWNGRANIGFNDGSTVPADLELHLTQDVTIEGKLVVDGKVYVPYGVNLTITDDAVIVNPENIIYEDCTHENTTTTTVNATCTETGSITVTCDLCGQVLSTEEIPMIDHVTELQGAKNPTCTEDGYTGNVYCTVCEQVVSEGEVIPALGHDWSDWTVTMEATCSAAGLEERTCATCGEVETNELPIDPENCPTLGFADLDADAWYHEYTDYVLVNGLMQGVGEETFAPNGMVTRAQLVTTLYRLAGEPEVTAENPFADVAEGQWYTDAIVWAYEVGVAKGISETLFGTNEAVTREQAATFLYRYVTEYLEVEATGEANLLKFTDGTTIQPYAVEAMSWAVANGIFQGNGDGTLQPAGTLIRIQLAKVLTVVDQAF